MIIDFTDTNFILLSVFAGIVFLHFLFIIIVFLRLVWYKPKGKTDKKLPVSVIICARNEAKNLIRNLPEVLEQDYPDFEVIVVNDSSTDNTERVLKDFSEKYSNLKVTKIEPNFKFTHGKKLAVSVGIKAAKNEWMLFTDADCRPASKNWISAMSSNFGERNNFVIGYGSYISQPSLLNNLIRFDTLKIAIRYLGFAITLFPYMAVGRNMAYRKSAFNNSKGFTRHLKLLSGDDDLFIHDNAKKKNTAVELSKDSITLSKARQNFKTWVFQKKRHLTTGPYYSFFTKLMLGFESLNNLSIYLFFGYLAYNNIYLKESSILFFGYLVIKIIVFSLISRRLNEKYIIFLLPLWEIFLPFFNTILVLSNKFSNNNRGWI